jgi:hypothetical protein
VTPRRVRLILLTSSLAAAALAVLRAGPPAPAPHDAPADQFSATRARDTVAELLGDGAPHPVGSPANAAVRERLLARLRALGLTPEVQRAFVCSGNGTCATVENVLAWLPGQVTGPAVALLSHYDSVPAGPGAADDMQGVAISLATLEILRDTPRKRPLAAIFTDGEEAGLLGARAFTEHPRFAEIGVALNAEARGTTGAARMFETSDDNLALISALADAPRPSALSLSYEVYRRLPNDTDLTVFKRRGAQGMNFAFVGGVQRYHTPRDDLAHLDLGSVQQQGDAVLASARALLDADLSQKPSTNAHYVDLFSAALVRWPAWVDVPLALLVLLALLATARRAAVPAATIARAAGFTLLAPLAGALAGFAAIWLIEQVSGPLGGWPAALHWPVLSASLLALAAAVPPLRRAATRAGALTQALGTWLVWTLLALTLAFAIPGASILLLLPAALAALVVVRPGSLLAPGLAAALACAVWAPLAPSLVEALGLSGAIVGAIVGWLATALAPACAEGPGDKDMSRATWLLLLAGLVCAGLAAAAPRTDVAHPAKLNLIHLTDLDLGAAYYAADAPAGLAPEVAEAVPWDTPRPILPWSARPLPIVRAEPSGRDGLTLTRDAVEPAGAVTRVHATLRAPAGALAAMLVLPGDAVAAISVGGRPLDPATLRPGPSDTRIVTVFGPPAEGLPLIVDLRKPTPWQLVALHPGLPASSPASARPDTAVPYQNGDLTAVVRAVQP